MVCVTGFGPILCHTWGSSGGEAAPVGGEERDLFCQKPEKTTGFWLKNPKKTQVLGLMKDECNMRLLKYRMVPSPFRAPAPGRA